MSIYLESFHTRTKTSAIDSLDLDADSKGGNFNFGHIDSAVRDVHVDVSMVTVASARWKTVTVSRSFGASLAEEKKETLGKRDKNTPSRTHVFTEELSV